MMTRAVVLSRRAALRALAGGAVGVGGLLAMACQSASGGPSPTPSASGGAKPAEPKPAESKPAAPAATSAPAAKPAESKPAEATKPAQAAPGAGAKLAPMKVGLQSNVLAAPTQVAIENGVFKEFGLTVEGVKFAGGGSEVRDAILGNHVQAGTFFASTLIIGAQDGAVGTAVASHLATRATGLVVRPDVGVKTVAELKGKKIGGARGASVSVILENKVLAKAGLTKADYQWVPLKSGGADSLGAMLAKTIDSYASTEPFVSLAEEKAQAIVLTTFEAYDPMPIFVGMPTSFVEQNPDSIVAFLKGWQKMAEFWNKEKEKSFQIVKAFLAGGGEIVSDEVLRKAMDRLDVKPSFDKGVLMPYLDETAELELKANNIKRKPDWNKVLRWDLWEKASKA